MNEICSAGIDLLCDSESCLDLLFVLIGILFVASMSFGYKVGRNYKR